MAKRRNGSNRRKARKAANFNQAVPRKRSKKKPDQLEKPAYNKEVPDPGWAATLPENAFPRDGQTTQEDLWSLNTGMANQFAGKTFENYVRALNTLLPGAAGGHQAGLPSHIAPAAQPASIVRNGIQAISRELLNHFIEQAHCNFQAANALARSRSPDDFVKVQSEFAKDNLNSILDAASRILIVATQMTIEAVRITQLARSRV
jgi:hypothetical protein